MSSGKCESATINGVEIPNTEVNMVRPSLADLADTARADAVLGRAPLPPGYHFRTYRSGDRDVWMNLLRAAEPFLVLPDNLFEKDFTERLDALGDRMFFVDTDAGETVGTTTAWWQPDWRNSGDWAQIHWVAVHPAHQGRGLSKPLVNRALRRLARSHQRAMLGTSTGRVWAIKVYLDYGFVPDPQERNDEKITTAWRALQRVLPHPALAEVLG